MILRHQSNLFSRFDAASDIKSHAFTLVNQIKQKFYDNESIHYILRQTAVANLNPIEFIERKKWINKFNKSICGLASTLCFF